MTLIDIERPEVIDDDRAGEVPAPTPAPTPKTAVEAAPRPPRRRVFADLAGPLRRSWGVALVAAWFVVIAVGLAVEPAPVNPDAAPPLVADLMSTVLMGAWGAMAAGIFQGRRFAAAASLGGGVVLLALTLGCPLSGHHAGIGAWWGIQLVGAAALLTLSRKALRSS